MIGAVHPPADDQIMTVQRVDQPGQVAGIALAIGVDTSDETGCSGPQTVRDRPRVSLARRVRDQCDRQRRGERL